MSQVIYTKKKRKENRIDGPWAMAILTAASVHVEMGDQKPSKNLAPCSLAKARQAILRGKNDRALIKYKT